MKKIIILLTTFILNSYSFVGPDCTETTDPTAVKLVCPEGYQIFQEENCDWKCKPAPSREHIPDPTPVKDQTCKNSFYCED